MYCSMGPKVSSREGPSAGLGGHFLWVELEEASRSLSLPLEPGENISHASMALHTGLIRA